METDIPDLSQVAVQEGFAVVPLVQNSRAKLRARPAEETEDRLGQVLTLTEPVKLVRNGEHGQPIGVVARQRKTQQGEVPGA